MEQHISDAGLALIKKSEGLRTHTYLDVAGLPTIGYGHKLLPGESYLDGIDDGEATALLRKDVAWAEHAVSTMVKVPLDQGQFDALVDFTFNLGAGTLQRSTALKELNAGNYDAVPALMEQYDRAGKVLPALEKRRADEAKEWVA